MIYDNQSAWELCRISELEHAKSILEQAGFEPTCADVIAFMRYLNPDEVKLHEDDVDAFIGRLDDVVENLASIGKVIRDFVY